MDPALAAVWTVRAGLDQLTIDADGFDVIWTRRAGPHRSAFLMDIFVAFKYCALIRAPAHPQPTHARWRC